MANSRLASRASFFAEVDVLSAAEAMPQRLWGQNLSEAGIFLQTTKPFHPGDRISLRFDVAENEVHVRAAEVVWVKPFEPVNVDGALPGIGVRFLSVDPPARAAIRRYVQAVAPREDSAANSDVPSDVPVPPATLEDVSFANETLPPLEALSLPPFDAMSLAPEEVARAETVEETRDYPLHGDFVHDESVHDAATLPPDEVFSLGGTLPPAEAAADVEHPLAGWRFELLPEESGPHDERMPPPSVTLPPDASFSLDDDDANGTHDTQPPFAVSLPPFELSGPAPAAAGQTHLSFDDDEPGRRPQPAPPPAREERGPDVLEMAAQQKVDQEFFAGKLSVLELPQAAERGSDAKRTRNLRVAWAAGLLLAGGTLGVVVGYQPAPDPVTARAPGEDVVVTTLPAPKPVAEAEAELLAAAPSAPSAPTSEPAENAPMPAEPAPPAAAESPAPTVPVVSPDEIATSAEGNLPRKQTKPREEVSLTNTVAPAESAGESTTTDGMRVEYGRITLPLEGGRVARSFGLDNPPRVVVDLTDAQMPRQKSDEIGAKGIARVRFGRPDPVHVRVVVELEGTSAPKGITTLKKGSTLSVAWR